MNMPINGLKNSEAATVRSNVAKRLRAFGVTFYIVGDNINVRKRPNRSAQVVAQRNTGHPVKVTSYGVPLSVPLSSRPLMDGFIGNI